MCSCSWLETIFVFLVWIIDESSLNRSKRVEPWAFSSWETAGWHLVLFFWHLKCRTAISTVEIKTRLWPLSKHKRQHSFEKILWRDWLVRQARSTYDWSKQWTWARSVLGKTKGQGWRSKKLYVTKAERSRKKPGFLHASCTRTRLRNHRSMTIWKWERADDNFGEVTVILMCI